MNERTFSREMISLKISFPIYTCNPFHFSRPVFKYEAFDSRDKKLIVIPVAGYAIKK